MSSVAAGPSGSSWILSPWRNLALFVGTPALILPAVWLANARFSTEGIYLFVASFGALGHHLPGMMRAYGDRALFRRFRVRFVVAPAFLVAVCVGFALAERSVLILAVFVWGVWHGLMQVHGFLRIYDARVGSTRRLTAFLDQSACVTWFFGAIAFSDSRVHFFLDHFYRGGGGTVSAGAIAGFRLALAVAIGVVTVAWVANAALRWRAGAAPSPVKILLLLTSISFFWYANVLVDDLLLAVVLFEIFHDVQYLSIVWLFNRRRVDADPGVGAFTRFLFRRSPGLVAIYLGLIFLYGSLNVVNETLLTERVADVLAGVLGASALLHFYYDGFIWKVRERSTRRALGLPGGEAEGRRTILGLPGWARHGLKWSLLVVPLGALGVSLAHGRVGEDDRRLMLAESLPDDPAAQRNRALVLYRRDALPEAVDVARRAMTLASGDEQTDERTRELVRTDLAAMSFQLGLRRLRSGDSETARSAFSEAVALDPTLLERAYRVGVARGEKGDRSEEELHYRAALSMDPEHARARFNLAVALAQQERTAEALVEAEHAARLLPDDERALQLVAMLRRRAR